MSLLESILALLSSIFKKKETTNTGTTTTTTTVNNENNNQQPTNNNMQNNNSNNTNMSSKYNGKVILLDNGHGQNCKGKMSPLFENGTRFFEYEFARDVVKRIAKELDKLGVKYEIITPEVKEDIALSTRANRANKCCDKYGKNNCVFISVHANAAGMGDKWMNARGWSVYTTKGITKSDAIATVFYEEAEKLLPKYNMTLRKDMTDGDPDYEANFTVIYKTLCPAILTENLFQDNKIDATFLQSETGRDVIAKIHVNAIKRITNLN